MKRFAKSCLVIAPALGIATFFLRLWLLRAGVDDRGLLVTTHTGNWLSLALMGLGLVLLLVCSLGVKGTLPYEKLFPKSLLSAIGCFCGAVGIFVTDIGEFGAAANMIAIASCVLGILAAGCLVVLGVFRLKGKQPPYGLYALVTLYCMFHILSQYQRWNIEPQLQLYLPSLLASIFLMLAAYQRTALTAGAGTRWVYSFFQGSATLLCFMAAAGEMPWFYLAMALWMGTADCSMDEISAPKPMVLPPEAETCIEMLEENGYSAYVVGGCVRDHLLGLTPHDYDLCTDATPEQLCEIFADYNLVRSGEKHGTIGVVMNGEIYEITTFRSETTYSDNRHPDAVVFVRTIEEDLARRDFTINAMAWSPTRGYADPFGGQEDLEKGILRAVGNAQERFEEDSLRILRGMRFAVRFRLQVEAQTLDAMFACAPLMENLAWERIQTELLCLLPAVSAQDLLDFRPILLQILPELAPTVDFDQKNPHHLYDIYTHIAHTVELTPPEPGLRLAALLHDIGKPQVFTVDEAGIGHFYGHGQVSADIARQILNRLKVSNLLKERVLFLIENHMDLHRPEKKSLRRRISKYGWEAELELLALQKADLIATGTDRTEDLENYAQIEALLEELQQEESCLTLKELAIKGADVIALGVAPGPEVGEILNTLLSQVLDETVPNEEEALIAAAKAIVEGDNT